MRNKIIIAIVSFLCLCLSQTKAEETISGVGSQSPVSSTLQFFPEKIHGKFYLSYNYIDINNPIFRWQWFRGYHAGINIDITFVTYKTLSTGVFCNTDTILTGNVHSSLPHSPLRVNWHLGTYLQWQRWKLIGQHSSDHLISNGVYMGGWDTAQFNGVALDYIF